MARILVDMDGVIANWGLQYDRDLDAYGPAAAGIPRTGQQTTFDLMDGRTDAEKAIIVELMNRPSFYAQLQPIEGALNALREMEHSGHEVRICTTPWDSNPTCVQDKLDWVRDYLGAEWVKRVIITHEKARVEGDILIDDRPDITGAESATWTQVFYPQPYNSSAVGFVLPSWAEWPRTIDIALHNPANGEVRTVSSTGGEKGSKPQRYDLIPVLPLDRLAELYARGAEKYAAHNWRRGYDWSLSYAAGMRHMTRFWGGEDIDPETKIPHPIAAAFHMFALTQFMVDFPQFDDRFKPEPAFVVKSEGPLVSEDALAQIRKTLRERYLGPSLPPTFTLISEDLARSRMPRWLQWWMSALGFDV